jgi:hypothetical protein
MNGYHVKSNKLTMLAVKWHLNELVIHLFEGQHGLQMNVTDHISFGGLVVSMLASGTQDCGFEPNRSHWIFRAKKSTACLPLEEK